MILKENCSATFFYRPYYIFNELFRAGNISVSNRVAKQFFIIQSFKTESTKTPFGNYFTFNYYSMRANCSQNVFVDNSQRLRTPRFSVEVWQFSNAFSKLPRSFPVSYKDYAKAAKKSIIARSRSGRSIC